MNAIAHHIRNEDELVNEAEAAMRLSMSPRTLQQWRWHGGGPRYVKIGRSIRYRASDLQTYIDQRLRNSTSELASHR